MRDGSPHLPQLSPQGRCQALLALENLVQVVLEREALLRQNSVSVLEAALPVCHAAFQSLQLVLESAAARARL